MKNSLLISFIVSFLAQNTFAQSTLKQILVAENKAVSTEAAHSVAVEPTSFWQKTWWELHAPFYPPDNWFAYGGLSLAVALNSLARKDVIEKFQEHAIKSDLIPEKSYFFENFGSTMPNVIYFGIFVGHAYFADDQESALRAELMFKATAYAGLVSQVMKNALRTRRPDGGLFSFPSGHTATAFAFATIVHLEHGPYWGALSYVAASLSGFSRIRDNRHFLHDVIAGAGLGLGYGLSIHHQLRKKDTSTTTFELQPVFEGAQFVVKKSF